MVNIQVKPAKINMSPIGFYMYGKHYLEASKRVRKPKGKYSPVPYYLVCQSIELFLKAWLSAHGVSIRTLRKKDWGHNLVRLLNESESRDLASIVKITESRVSNIRLATEYYDNSKKFNYADLGIALKGYPNLPDLVILKRFALSLEKSSYEKVIRA